MRTAFIHTLCDSAEKNERIWLLCGDLGFSVLETFAEKFPDRFVNVGVAEQNMAGVATGLALSGKIVFVYSIANFPVMRCFEQIRNDICYHNANVKIVAVGGGLAYGSAGYTHHGVEDLGVMRLLPNMKVIAPADSVEAKLATEAIVEDTGPCYLRLGKSRGPKIHNISPDFQLGKAITIQQGRDLTIISTGTTLKMVINAADELRQRYSLEILSMHTIEPLDNDAVIQAAKKTGRIITVEEHAIGGLGSAVAEVLAGVMCKFAPIRLNKQPIIISGSQETLRESQGLCEKNIINTIEQLICPISS